MDRDVLHFRSHEAPVPPLKVAEQTTISTPIWRTSPASRPNLRAARRDTQQRERFSPGAVEDEEPHAGTERLGETAVEERGGVGVESCRVSRLLRSWCSPGPAIVAWFVVGEGGSASSRDGSHSDHWTTRSSLARLGCRLAARPQPEWCPSPGRSGSIYMELAREAPASQPASLGERV